MTATREPAGATGEDGETTLFLCGDVMLGRGIDRILPRPVDPLLREAWVTSAEVYVTLAERAHGEIPRRVAPDYVWGDALPVLAAADARVVNLETSITRHGDFWPKAVNYRMAPEHVGVLTAAAIDGCALANNHVLDFGRAGLEDTLTALRRAGIPGAGAGADRDAAAAPAVIEPAGQGRILVFGYGAASSGIPESWVAGPGRSGVNLLPDLSEATLTRVLAEAEAWRAAGDLLVASVHWGGNWGYGIPAEQVRFAHGLIEGGFDIVHGHSSHHPKAIEIHRGKPIMYGCGDFITDYEGITGNEAYRGDMGLGCLPRLSRPDNTLVGFDLVPFRMRRFRLEHLPESDRAWLGDVLGRECARFGTRLVASAEAAFAVEPA